MRTSLPKQSRQAIVLILVLVTVAVLALAAFTFADLMLTEYEAVDLHGQHLQARSMAESGIDRARLFLMNDWEIRLEEGGIYDNPTLFKGVLVVDDEEVPARRGRFTLIAPKIEEGSLGGVRFGLENESTRLNLNSLLLADAQQENGGRTLLSALPGMTDEIADAILDWLDEDDEPREFGAELDYYSGMSPPYAPRNGPLETVGELLLIRGVLPELLFGLDTNRNGMVDAHEQGGRLAATEDVDEGAMDRGWSAYLTLYSQEANRNSAGEPRIYLNQEDMGQLHAELAAAFPLEWANFIVAYRQNGPYTGNKAGESSGSGTLDLTKKGSTTLVQVLDLIGAKTQVTFEGDDESTVLNSPFPEGPFAMGVYMPTLMDNVTINDAPTIPGRVNVNQATRLVLSGIPGMSEEIVNQIVSLRSAEPEAENPNRRHETWLLVEAVVTLSEMRTLMPFITAGGDVYRTQSVGYFEGGQAATRAEVIIDATSPMPQILSWRDISHLGRGYALETLGIGVIEE